ncbi:T9SS sorting signal type C domain-containing protein [Flavobacterium sp. GB2R13]|uniref:T9SS sorting signal type C domain-containing protein n=1 Tax=Flavobacterium algoris TaxID=3398733 RepID=UPI003A8C6EA7
MIDKILIFDISGKLLYKKINIDNNKMTILNLTSREQTLLMKIVLKNGQTVTRKIIY